MKGVVISGGLGTRLDPLTRVVNKNILPIYNKPMIYYPINTLKELGITEILIIVGGNSIGDVINLLKDGEDLGVDLTYRYQSKPIGIANAVSLARNFVGKDKFAVILGDNIFENSHFGPPSFKRIDELEAMFFFKEVNDPERFGVPVFDDNNHLIKIEEKPKEPKSNYAVVGLYFYSPIAFEIIDKLQPSGRGEYEITDLNNELMKRGHTTYGVIKGDWIDAGTFESLYNASKTIRERVINVN